MEEKLKRSDRRYRKVLAIKRRIKRWLFFNIYVPSTRKTIKSNAEKIRYVLDGEGFHFLRTTSNPCNCYTCSGEKKYNRAKEKTKARKNKLI